MPQSREKRRNEPFSWWCGSGASSAFSSVNFDGSPSCKEETRSAKENLGFTRRYQRKAQISREGGASGNKSFVGLSIQSHSFDIIFSDDGVGGPQKVRVKVGSSFRQVVLGLSTLQWSAKLRKLLENLGPLPTSTKAKNFDTTAHRSRIQGPT